MALTHISSCTTILFLLFGVCVQRKAFGVHSNVWHILFLFHIMFWPKPAVTNNLSMSASSHILEIILLQYYFMCFGEMSLYRGKVKSCYKIWYNFSRSVNLKTEHLCEGSLFIYINICSDIYKLWHRV